MYIKLIQPKMLRRPMDTDLKARMAPPLGLLTIVSILRENHKVRLENENIEKINFDDKPDLVGISLTVDVLDRGIEISRKFREKGIPVVAGGIMITTAPDFIPRNAFDSICIGSGEGTWPDIIKDIQSHSLKKIYSCPENFTADHMVSPAYDFVKKSKYLYTNIVHTSRGCPFHCDFCYNSSKNHKYINRNIEDVLADIKKINLRHIMFIDDNFIGNPQWTRKFLQQLKPLKIKWNAAVSINVANDGQLLDLMKESGCKSLFIGFESINPWSISNVHKVQNNIQNYEKAISEIHRRGIMIHGSFVFGLDGDTRETFKTTLDWIVKNKIETVTSHILTPYPGTKVYEELKKADRITSTDFSKYNTAHVVYKPKNMTAEELYQGYLWIYRNVYSIKNILKRLPDSREQRAAYLTFNLFYRKYGKVTDFLCKIISYRLVGKIAQLAGKYLQRLQLKRQTLLFAGCVSIHSPVSKGNFENLNIQFENVELSNPGSQKLIKTTISGWILDSAFSISSYKIRYQGDKVFIDIDRKTGTSGMALDYYIQFLMQPGVKDIYIGKDLFWTRSAESFFKSKNMNFPLNILVEKDYSAIVAWGPVERDISPQESASVKKFADYISKKLTMEECKKWNKNAIAFEISEFGIYAEHDRKYLMISVQAYFEGLEDFDMRRPLGRHQLSVLHNILLFDYHTFQEKGWVYQNIELVQDFALKRKGCTGGIFLVEQADVDGNCPSNTMSAKVDRHDWLTPSQFAVYDFLRKTIEKGLLF